MRARSRRVALNMPLHDHAWKCIGRNRRRLANLKMGQLRFFVIRDHPYVGKRHESYDLRAHARILAGLDLPLPYLAVARRDDACIAEIDPRKVECGALGRQRRSCLSFLRIVNRELAFGGLELSLVLLKNGSRLLFVRIGLFDELRCSGDPRCQQVSLTLSFKMIAGQCCFGRLNGRCCRRDIILLKPPKRANIFEGRLRACNIGLGLSDLRLVIDIDDRGYKIASLDALIIGNRNSLDIAGDAGGQRRYIGRQIGIVSPLRTGCATATRRSRLLRQPGPTGPGATRLRSKTTR